MTGAAALQQIVAASLVQIAGNEAAVLAGVADGIHQMRVAARRLRAALSAFAEFLPAEEQRHADDELRWLAGALGPARNLDVFMAEVLGPAGKMLGEPGIPALLDAVDRARHAAYAGAARAVGSRRYTALLLRQRRWVATVARFDGGAQPSLDAPIGKLVAGILDRRRRVAKRRSKRFAHQSAAQRHKLRIALKKLRYACEMLGSLRETRAALRFIDELKRLQDGLGDANDLRVARGIIASLVRCNDGDAPLAAAGAGIVDWHERRIAARQRRLHRDLDRLIAAKPFWDR